MTFVMKRIAPAIILCIHIYLVPVFGQQNGPQADAMTYTHLVKKGYGLDQDLVNGLQYYNRNMRGKGHPYFHHNQFSKGAITIEGEVFQDVSLKFDIHAQHVELEYQNFSGGSNRVITIFDHVDAFILGEYQFSKLNLDGGSKKYYQVISTTCFTLYVFWEKELVPLSGSTTYTEQFSDPNHSFWLDLDGVLTPINSRKDFSECFPEEDRKEIKRLLSSNQFQFRTSQVAELVHNMNSVCKHMRERENH
jgi:hypothetical protein